MQNKTVNELERLIKASVKKLEGMPVALSGGIDSGLLAALMKPSFAITVSLPYGKKYDEMKYVDIIANHLKLNQHVISLDDRDFDKVMKKAVKIIGKAIPHFNIFPLYVMYRTLNKIGETDLVVGDGPDESMSGYTRDLIFNYIMGLYTFPAFSSYDELIFKTIGDPVELYAKLASLSTKEVSKALPLDDNFVNLINMESKRPEMNLMNDKLAKHFKIKLHRPYESKKVDEFMFNLPPELKIHKVEYGKHALRLIAKKYLPKEVAWRKDKMGGPVYPVNVKKGWDGKDGEFGKKSYMKHQREILNGS